MNTTAENPAQLALEGNPLPLMLKMAAPNAAAFVIQATVSMTEVWYVGQLGTVPLAAMAFVFPGLMLTQMLAGGALGGAVASAVARALGSGDRDRAARLIWHAIYIALSAGLVFYLIFAFFGESLLRLIGADGQVLTYALSYASILFAGCTGIWMSALLTGVFRGMGNMQFPAVLMAGGGLIQAVVSGALVLGWFGAPKLGIQGAAISVVSISCISALIAVSKLAFSKSPLSLNLQMKAPSADLFADIFKVGALAALSPFLTVASIMIVNAVISGFGTAIVAGYGIGSRLEFLLIPMVFGFGAAMNTMVGMNVGAGNVKRAEYIALVGGGASTALTGVVGLTLAIFPEIWIGLFTDDPGTLAAGAQYLRFSGWAFAFQGMGLSLYFASQGAGKVFWPVMANIFRFVVGAGGAFFAVKVLGLEVYWVFVSLALGMACYGLVTAGSIWAGAWRR